jgi:hypothetical protein
MLIMMYLIWLVYAGEPPELWCESWPNVAERRKIFPASFSSETCLVMEEQMESHKVSFQGLEAITNLKWRMPRGTLCCLVIAMVKNLQICVPLFIFLVVDANSMEYGVINH